MSFDDLLKSLQQDYLKSLPAKIRVIQEQIEAGDSTNVRESFHKLKGTGKTYGFPEVSELAAAVENVCIVNPALGLKAAREGLAVLRDIHMVRQNSKDYALTNDTRLSSIRKLLPG